MTSDFYQKASKLYKEFNERELQNISAGNVLNKNLSWNINKRDVSLEQYLQKICQREKETEETYIMLMKKMEHMEQQTESISLKLEKLKLLKDNIPSTSTSSAIGDKSIFSLPSSHGSNLPFGFGNKEDMTKKPHSKSEQNKTSCPTQTDTIICKQCKHPICISTDSVTTDYANETVEQTPRIQYVKRNSTEDKTVTADSTYTLHEIQQNTLSEVNNRTNYSSEPDISKKNNANSIIQTELESSENRELIETSESRSSFDQDMVKTQNMPRYQKHDRNKSDDESVNHEFDFLESDNRSLSDDLQVLNNKTSVHREIAHDPSMQREHVDTVPPKVQDIANLSPVISSKITDNSTKMSSVPSPRQRRHSRENIHSQKHLANSDKQVLQNDIPEAIKINNLASLKELPTNYEASSLCSENASAATDTEGSSDKDVPLTQTAAYQALLGGSHVSQRLQKKEKAIESDSEDDVEAVLAKAVKKSSISVSSSKVEKKSNDQRKPSIAQPAVADKLDESPKKALGTSSNKTQSKLSKSTRKVLGLDTSSGSEMEQEKAPSQPEHKTDSDEFDFYD